MQTGQASKTAFSVAVRRAAHQLEERPPVLEDAIVGRLVRAATPRQMERARHPVAQDFRCFLAARSRYAEDHLAEAVAAGVRQYVILGAGLDTFALRNPHAGLRVFEVDFPATQAWKRGLVAEAGLEEPAELRFVPLDFERHTLREGLGETDFNFAKPAFVSWLGVVPYLTLAGFRATAEAVGGLASGSGLCFDYCFPPESLTPARQTIFARLAARVAAAGEPFQLFFTPAELDEELKRAGFGRTEQSSTSRLNELYFAPRADGLRLSLREMGNMAVAWVEEARDRRRGIRH